MRCKGLTKKSSMCKNQAGSFPFCRHHRPPAFSVIEEDKDAENDSDGNEKDVCPICLITITDRFPLRCSHVFCEQCIFEWLRTKRSCPICRAIPSNEEIDPQLTAPPDGRSYDVTGLPMDWTEDEGIFDIVESLDVPVFTWDDGDLPTGFGLWLNPFFE
jgi:hypothetical protein